MFALRPSVSRVKALPAALLALFGAAAPLPLRAQTGELTTTDRAAALYSTQFTFDGQGVPVINVAVAEGRDEVHVSAKSGLRILPSGPQGPEVQTAAGLTWTARVEGGRPASVRYWVVIERLPARDLAELRAARQRWSDQGVSLKTFEVGSVFSFAGQVMDSRAVLFALDEAHSDYEAAKRAVEAASERFGRDCSTHAKLDDRPAGVVVLSSDRGSVTVRHRDVIWLTANDASQPLRVRGAGARGTDREYRGRLYLAVDRHGKLSVVSSVDGETMLRGIVPAEIYPTSALDALKAQAVVARGELLAKIGSRHLADPFLLCAEVHCQAYHGVGKEHARTDRAIRETRGEMLFADDDLVDSVYSASCGGHTEHNEYVWPSPAQPNLRGTFDGPSRPAWLTPGEPMSEEQARRWVTEPVDAWCARSTKGRSSFRWSKVLGADELSALVAKRHPEVGRVTGLEVLLRGVSGRARSLEVRGSAGRVTVERELTIRRLLGGLKSGAFVVDAEPAGARRPDRFRIQGGGFGHGVGLCQVGSIGMAEAGRRYDAILSHYYAGAKPRKVY